ncbi:MAG: hypothetical protein ACKO87_08605 [Dolichospermum sp.]
MIDIHSLEISKTQAQKELKELRKKYRVMQEEGYYDLGIVEQILCLEITINPDIAEEQWSNKVRRLLKTRRI